MILSPNFRRAVAFGQARGEDTALVGNQTNLMLEKK
jgi:hypothetical protein